MMKKIIY